MNKNQARKIFEKYNPSDDVVHFPSGRATMCDPLDTYAKAAVNLYGIIRLDEFVEIFNAHNEEKTTTDEVYTILLPNVLKYGKYGFYKDYIVHYSTLSDFDMVERLKKEQGNKPRYIPPKKQFLLFESEEYDENNHWQKLQKLLFDSFGYSKATVEAFLEMRSCVPYVFTLKGVNEILDNHDLIFDGEKQLQDFLNLFVLAAHNTRAWENKGYTLNELEKLLESQRAKGPKIHRPKKVQPNQPCPCGSGKKYKKCCAPIGISGAAQISSSERKLFYETWYKLLDFVNQKLHVVHYKFSLQYPDFHDETLLRKIREKLWANKELIGEFLRSDSNLSDKEINLLQSWEKHHVKARFVLVKYELEHAVFMTASEDRDIKLYAVKGMTESIAESLHLQLPVILDTVLLPFGDKIIYDSYMALDPFQFDDENREMFECGYNTVKEKNGIIFKLGNS